MKIPRKTKKVSALKRGLVLLDIASIPKKMDIATWLRIASFGLVLWDSKRGGKEPKLTGRKYKRFNVVDISKNSPNLREIKQLTS